MNDIQDVSRVVAEKFSPQRVILFGSHAVGTEQEDSDVDLLVVMDHSDASARAAARVRSALHVPFALDLMVRSESELQKRVTMGDSFFLEVLQSGKVLYDVNSF